MSTATKVAMATIPTAAELRERDSAGWGWTRPPESYDVTASQITLPESPAAVDWRAVAQEARDKKRHPTPETWWATPNGQLWAQVLDHMDSLRTVAEAHGHALVAHDLSAGDTITSLKAYRDADAQKITALELTRDTLAAKVAELEGYILTLLDLREKDAGRLSALEKRKAAR